MSTQQRAMQPAAKAPSDEENDARRDLRRETGFWAFIRRSFAGEKEAPALVGAQARWRRILADAQELEKSCSLAHERLQSADRAKDPEQAAADMAEADTYLHRASQLLMTLEKLKRGFRAPFQFSPSAQRRVKDFTRAAATLRIDRAGAHEPVISQGRSADQEQDQSGSEELDTRNAMQPRARRRR